MAVVLSGAEWFVWNENLQLTREWTWVFVIELLVNCEFIMIFIYHLLAFKFKFLLLPRSKTGGINYSTDEIAVTIQYVQIQLNINYVSVKENTCSRLYCSTYHTIQLDQLLCVHQLYCLVKAFCPESKWPEPFARGETLKQVVSWVERVICDLYSLWDGMLCVLGALSVLMPWWHLEEWN